METTTTYYPDNEAWKDELCEHCRVLWFTGPHKLSVYAVVRSTPADLLARGYRHITAYSSKNPFGRDATMPVLSAAMPLSKEQHDLARQLGWPNDEVGLMRIFGVPSN